MCRYRVDIIYYQSPQVLNTAMVTDHLPGGYNSVFRGVGEVEEGQLVRLNISVLDSFIRRRQSQQLTEHRETEEQGKWGIFKSNVKDFFKGIG